MTPAGVRLVLASRSPQRRTILETLGVAFTAVPSDVPELSAGDPREVAVENALRKARAVAEGAAGAAGAAGAVGAAGATSAVVLGVDTVVALGGRIYGKPLDAASARSTLRALSGAVHTVISGVALLGLDPSPRVAAAATEVRFARLSDAIVDWYVESGEWRERAGGYAIQGRGMALIERIEGDYSNVVGLPVAALLELWPGLLDPAAQLPRICSDFCM